MSENAVPDGLVGGAPNSRSPTLLQMWCLQWAPGACLIGWPLAALALALASAGNRAGTAEDLVFLALGMLLSGLLWALIVGSSTPLFLAMRPWIERRISATLPTRHRTTLAVIAVTPMAVVSCVFALLAQNRGIAVWTMSGTQSFIAVVVFVGLCLGVFAATEMWRSVRPARENTRWARSSEVIDLTSAVRAKEDLEVLRLVLANSAMVALNFFLLVIVPTIVVVIALGLLGTGPLLVWVPSLVAVCLALPLAVLGSYQIGLWQFVSIRCLGVLLLAAACVTVVVACAGPVTELYEGTQLGYGWPAWAYTALLWLLTVPPVAVAASIIRMALRLIRLRSEVEPVVHGWRPWPTQVGAVALRAVCLPTFLVTLPRGWIRPFLLFALAAAASAVQTGLLFGLPTQSSVMLDFLVRSVLAKSGGSTERFATLGAAITAAFPTEPSLRLTMSELLVATTFVLALVLFAVGVWLSQKIAASLLHRAHRRAALGYQHVIKDDARKPVLFLRSFREDQRLLEPPMRSLLAKVLRLKNRRRTLDEIVLDAASPVGPVLALAAPGEEIAPLGAARLHVDDTIWQNTIRELAQRSRAVIMYLDYLDEGRGVLWELEHLLTAGHDMKTLCLLNPRTSLVTVQRALAELSQSAHATVIGKLERIRDHLSNIQAGRFLVGIRFADNMVVPIISDNVSDYTYWCMVNLMLLGLE
jgi:hypothetical protein